MPLNVRLLILLFVGILVCATSCSPNEDGESAATNKTFSQTTVSSSAVARETPLEKSIFETASSGLTIVLEETQRHLSAEKYRESITGYLDAESGNLVWDVDPEILLQNIKGLMADQKEEKMLVSRKPSDNTEAVFVNRRICCASLNQNDIATIKRGGQVLKVSLTTEENIFSRELEDMGIRKITGEFTTYYEPEKTRVLNIERISDLVNGVVVGPGETWSLNDYVGKRTIENGFYAARGLTTESFVESVGGGISQYVTTLFNAAFFAGLDFETYQAHTLHLPEYPYGREATISFPTIDFVIKNTTPYAILINTEYSPTSITARIYSTRYYVEVMEEAQIFESVGLCTKVTTPRIRILPNGDEVRDSVEATYQPELGVRCF